MIYKFYKCAPELMKASQSRHGGQHFKGRTQNSNLISDVFSLYALRSQAAPLGWWAQLMDPGEKPRGASSKPGAECGAGEGQPARQALPHRRLVGEASEAQTLGSDRSGF